MEARSFRNQLAQLLFPQRHCLLCGRLTGQPGICPICEEERQGRYSCDICAGFVAEPGLCRYCAHHMPPFSQARAAWPYAGAMRNHLRAFKYREQTWLGRPLALLLAQTFQEHYGHLRFDAVLPTPLSHTRKQQRGYNQSELLSSILAAETGINHQPHLLLRVKDTPPLATYNGSQRRAILKQAFAASFQVEGQTLLLIDDIYTSGATLTACTVVLKAAGASRVYGLTAAAFDAQEKAGI